MNSRRLRPQHIHAGDIIGRVTILYKKDSNHYIAKCNMCDTVDEYKLYHLNRNKYVCSKCSRCYDLREVGKRNRLTPIRYLYSKNGDAFWEFQCDCGEKTVVSAGSFLSGHAKSCGCYYIESRYNTKHGDATTNGRDPLYSIWNAIKFRCYNPNSKHYHRYGGRGIKVCERWLDWDNGYKNFKNDMGEGYEPGLTIDRIDNNGDYEPGNCRWSTQKEQQRNKETNRSVTYNGVFYHCAQQLCDEFCQKYDITDKRTSSNSLIMRIDAGWTVEEALKIPTLEKNERKDKWMEQHGLTEWTMPEKPIIRPISFNKSLINPNYDPRNPRI